jgi:CHAD domain-containing protein
MTRSAPLRLPPAPDRAIRAGLDRVLDRVERAASDLIDRPEASVVLLHGLHRQGRRLGVLLRAWKLGRPLRDGEDLRGLAGRLKRLTRLVGQVRDRDVTLALLGKAGPVGRAPHEAREANRFLARIRDEAKTGRELLRVHARTEVEAGLFRQIRAIVDRPGRGPPATRTRRLLAEELAGRRAKVLRARRRANQRPTPQRLHELRIRIRRLRHLEEITRPLRIGEATPGRNQLRALQARLGRIHDLDLALASMAPTLKRSAWARRLRELRRVERGKAEETIAQLERLLARRAVGARPRPPH